MEKNVIKEMLLNFTNGKMVLLEKNDFWQIVDKVRSKSTASKNASITSEKDVYDVRHELQNFISQKIEKIKDKINVYNILLVFTEFSTNMIKHALGGDFYSYFTDNEFYMLFKDKGKGINLDKIPYMILSNYSSLEDSLGFGFTICLKLSDSIWIETSQEGTSILVLLKI